MAKHQDAIAAWLPLASLCWPVQQKQKVQLGLQPNAGLSASQWVVARGKLAHRFWDNQ